MYNNDSQTTNINTDVWDIVNKVQSTVDTIVDNMYDHPQRDLIEKQYQFMLQDFVYQMTSLPVNREEIGIDPVTDPHDLKHAYDQIMDIISLTFGYTKQKIEKDIKPYLHQYDVDDIRTIKELRKNNKLN